MNQLVQQNVQSTKDDSPTFHGPKNDLLERQLQEAIQDEELTFHSPRLDLLKSQLKKKPARSFKAIFETPTDDLLEQGLEEATKDDVYVPTSLDNSFLKESSYDNNDFEDVNLSMSPLSIDDNQELKYFSLDKVLPGHLPPGIIRQNYSFGNQIKLIELFQNNNIENTEELFEFFVQNIHHKYTNCVTNLGQWLRNPHSDEPIFYRNCVPCTNAVDLNLQSLFNNYIHTEKLEHYFVNTCEMAKQWISYISDMEHLSIDFKRHPTTTFTDVIRQNLLSNHRLFNGIHLKSILINEYLDVFQGIVKSDRANNQKGFLHVCNLINDEYGQIWILDGQIQRVFHPNQEDHIKELDQRYRSDYVTRAYTGLFRPRSLIQNSKEK